MTVLQFISASEYRKERARILAKALSSALSVDALLEGGDLVAEDLLTVLGDELADLLRQALADARAHAEANGLVPINEAEAIVTLNAALDRVLGAARQQLLARLADLDASVTRMLDATSAEAVTASLASTATTEALLAPIASVLTSAAAGAIQAVEGDLAREAVAATHEQAMQDGGASEPQLFQWQTVQDDKVCSDILENSCEPRHGRELTYDEWGVFGYPGDPDSPTICSMFAKNAGASNCRCNLLPAGSAVSSPTPINAADAISAGRQRALDEAA